MGLRRFIVNQRKFCRTKVACADIDVVAQYEGQHHCSFFLEDCGKLGVYSVPTVPKRPAVASGGKKENRNATKVVY